jgi:hypothetical protein
VRRGEGRVRRGEGRVRRGERIERKIKELTQYFLLPVSKWNGK